MKTTYLALICLSLAGAAGCSKGDSANQQAGADGFSAPDVGSALRTGADPVVALRTTLGVIEIRLNTAKAPLTVDNFLAQVESGFYHQTIFHQVEPGYVVLAGAYRPDLTEKKSRYSIPNEAANGLANRRGTVSMARSPDSLDSDTGQFFINVGDNAELDHQDDTAERFGYCVFGEVVKGMEVVDRIAQLQTKKSGSLTSLPVETVMIEAATKLR